MGREMAGMPKKACDSIIVEKNGDTAHGAIIKDGVTLLDCSLKLGSYNTPAGEQMFGANVPGNVVKNDTFLLKYDLEQADDGHMYFDNGRVLVTHSNSEYEYWMPATAEVTLTPCNNAPWASLPVNKCLPLDSASIRWMVSPPKESVIWTPRRTCHGCSKHATTISYSDRAPSSNKPTHIDAYTAKTPLISGVFASLHLAASFVCALSRPST